MKTVSSGHLEQSDPLTHTLTHINITLYKDGVLLDVHELFITVGIIFSASNTGKYCMFTCNVRENHNCVYRKQTGAAKIKSTTAHTHRTHHTHTESRTVVSSEIEREKFLL